MGLTHVTASIINPANPKKKAKADFLVDSGAVYTVAPGHMLKRLGIKPHSSRVFTLADGTQITRRLGDAIFAINLTRPPQARQDALLPVGVR
jgi:predicted aspartyl protease